MNSIGSIRSLLAHREVAGAILLVTAIIVFGHLANTTSLLVERSRMHAQKDGRIARCSFSGLGGSNLVDVWLEDDPGVAYRSRHVHLFESLCPDRARVAVTYRTIRHNDSLTIHWIEGLERLDAPRELILKPEPIVPENEAPSYPLLLVCAFVFCSSLYRLLKGSRAEEGAGDTISARRTE